MCAGLFLTPAASSDAIGQVESRDCAETKASPDACCSCTGSEKTAKQDPLVERRAGSDTSNGCSTRPVEQEEKSHQEWTSSPTGIPAIKLLDKLRWACLGPNFDWTNRRYLYEKAHRQLPVYLVDAAQRCANLAASSDGKPPPS